MYLDGMGTTLNYIQLNQTTTSESSNVTYLMNFEACKLCQHQLAIHMCLKK